MQQEPFLFNDTIYKNVEHGLIGTEWEYDTDDQKMELVKRACEEAFADEFINGLPQVCCFEFLRCEVQCNADSQNRDITHLLVTLESNSAAVNVSDLQLRGVLSNDLAF